MKVDGIWREVPALKGTFWNKDPEETILFANTLNSPTEEEAKDTLPLEPRKSEYRSVSVNKIWVKTLTGKEVELSISGFTSSNSGDGSVPTELTEQVNGNTEQIQNCVQSLDDSLVAVISPQGISSNVVGDDTINKGGNVIEGTGVSFVKSEDGFGIGEGYENLFSEKLLKSNSANFTVVKISEYEYEITCTNDNYSIWDTLYFDNYNSFETGKSYTFQVEFEDKNVNDYVRHTYLLDGIFEGDGDVKGELKDRVFVATGVAQITNTSGWVCGIRFLEAKLAVGEKIKIKAMFSNAGNKVPFVPHSFKGGELKINGDITLDDYSYIFGGIIPNIELSNTMFIATTYRNGAIALGEGIVVDLTQRTSSGKFSIIANNTIAKVIEDNGNIFSAQVNNRGKNIQGVLNLVYSDDKRAESIEDVVISHGNISEEKLLEKLNFIKSGNYSLPPNMQGTIFPVEGMVRRGNEYGIVNPYIFATADRVLGYTVEDHDFEVLVEGESSLKVVSVTSGVSSDPSTIRVDGKEIVANVNIKKFRRI